MTQRRRAQTITEEVTYEFVCDSCGKTARVDPPRRSVDTPAGWHSFSSSHSDWGNDSIDSFESYDVCSWGCYLRIVRREVEDYHVGAGAPSLVVDGRDFRFLTGMLTALGSREPQKGERDAG